MVSEGVARADLELREFVESRRLPPVMHPAFWRRWAAKLKLGDHVVDSCLSTLPGWQGLAELILVPEELELPGHHRAAGLRQDDAGLMAEVVNLRRARKAKGRAEKARVADANRTKHGVAKSVRDLAKARAAKEQGDLEARKLDDR